MAKIYWRTIKRGTRSFSDVPEVLKEAVKKIAKEDVINKVITEDDYETLIGESYSL